MAAKGPAHGSHQCFLPRRARRRGEGRRQRLAQRAKRIRRAHLGSVSERQMKKATKEKVTATRGARALRDDARYLMNTYKRPPVVFSHGKGCYLYDHRGRKYLDFLGGIAVNARGHAYPRLWRLILLEAARASHMSILSHKL